MESFIPYQEIPQLTENSTKTETEIYLNYFLLNFRQNRNQELFDESIPDTEDYSFLLLLLLIWLKANHDQITLKYISQVHFNLIIQKSIGKDSMSNFLKLFEELTLKRLQIVDNDLEDFWLVNLYF